MLLAVLLGTAVFGFATESAAAQEATLYFLTVKQGQEQVGGNLFNTLAANHGPLQGDKTVTQTGFSFDIYAVTRKKYGLAISLELMDYDKTFPFKDPTGTLPPEQVRLQGRSVLYSLEGFLRFGDFLPFIGIGTGTYYVSYNEQVSKLSFIDTATNVFTSRIGFRWLLVGRWGILAEVGQTSAPIQVVSNNKTSTLDLGGPFWNGGISYVW